MSSASKLWLHLTEDQITLSAAQLQDLGPAQGLPRGDSPILTREWVHMRQSSNDGKGVLRVMTWNVSSGWPKRSVSSEL